MSLFKRKPKETVSVTIREWVDAMRDGSHKHTTGSLSRETAGGYEHCALGVLADKLGYSSGPMFMRAPDGTMAAGATLGQDVEVQLRQLKISPSAIAIVNDENHSYDKVIEHITCTLGVDPDAEITVDETTQYKYDPNYYYKSL